MIDLQQRLAELNKQLTQYQLAIGTPVDPATYKQQIQQEIKEEKSPETSVRGPRGKRGKRGYPGKDASRIISTKRVNSDYQITKEDNYIGVASPSVILTLPEAAENGLTITVKLEKQESSALLTTKDGSLIDSKPEMGMNFAFQALTVVSCDGDWFILNSFVP